MSPGKNVLLTYPPNADGGITVSVRTKVVAYPSFEILIGSRRYLIKSNLIASRVNMLFPEVRARYLSHQLVVTLRLVRAEQNGMLNTQ